MYAGKGNSRKTNPSKSIILFVRAGVLTWILLKCFLATNWIFSI